MIVISLPLPHSPYIHICIYIISISISIYYVYILDSYMIYQDLHFQLGQIWAGKRWGNAL